MAAKKNVEEFPSHQYRVLSDRFVGGKKNSTVSLPASPQVAVLVEAGHLEPASKAAKEATP